MTYSQFKAAEREITMTGLRDFASGKRSNFQLAKSKITGLKDHYKQVKSH